MGASPLVGIIGLVGAKRAGKDSVAEILAEIDERYVRVAFADRLKTMAAALNPYVMVKGYPMHLNDAVENYGDGVKDFPDVRCFYQDFGHLLREDDPFYWIRYLYLRTISRLPDECTAVVTDVRYANEIEFVRKHKGVIWRIDRPEVEDGDPHPTEREWRACTPDFIISNTGTLTGLRWSVQVALAQMSASPS